MRLRMSLLRQLILTHLIVLIISLGVIVASLFILFSARPAPPEPVYQRLAALMQGLNARDAFDDILPSRNNNDNTNRPSQPNVNRQNQNQAEFKEILEDILWQFSDDNEVRVLLILGRGEQRNVFYDSHDGFARGQAIYFREDNYNSPNLDRFVGLRGSTAFGQYRSPDDSTWLFSAVSFPNILSRLPNTDTYLLISEPTPTRSLQSVLSDFSNDLLLPIVQAGIFSFIVAVVLAWLVSRDMVKPLRNLVMASQAVAKGDYSHPVPERGATEVRALATAFNDMRDEVQASQQAQRDFLANVSHDLKTPLTSIQGYAQAITDGAAPNPTDAAHIIHDEAARLNRMVFQLTDLMRMQSGRLSMQKTALDMGAITTGISERLSVVAEKRDITLHVNAPSMPHVAGDGDRIAQVLVNLISNAIKYTPKNGNIYITTKSVQDGVEVAVQDTGIGIPAEDLPRIFERFYQVDKARGPQRGTGLGLAIAKEIIEAHGGKISVSSDGKNKGTRFAFWLPSPNLKTTSMKAVSI